MFQNILLNVLLIYKFEFVCIALFYMCFLYESFHTVFTLFAFPKYQPNLNGEGNNKHQCDGKLE